MELGIAGKTALVCGASKGLGYGCAEALVKEGVNVVIVARTAADLQAAAARLQAVATQGATVSYVAADITNLIVWHSANATWEGSDTRLFTNASGLGGGLHQSATALALALGAPSTNYFFITADVAPAATVGGTIFVNPALATTNVMLTSGTKSGSTTTGGWRRSPPGRTGTCGSRTRWATNSLGWFLMISP